jgi:hypothetical protein
MTSIAHRVEEDIQRLAERMGVSGQRASEPTEQPLAQQQQQQQHDAAVADKAAAAAAVAAAAAAAAASAAEVPLQLPNGGLDLQLLQQLADSGSVTSQSDTDGTKDEEDTAAHSGSTKRTKGAAAQQQSQPQDGLNQQQLQECSQQVHMHDKGTVSEVVQGEPKRRKLGWQGSVTGPSDAAMAGAAAAAIAAAANGGGSYAAAANAAVGGEQLTEQPRQQQQAAVAAAADQHVVATVHAQQPPPQQQQVFAEPLPPIACLLPQRCSSTGCATGSEQQSHSLAASEAAAAAAAAASCSACARHGSIMRQTQVALTTWQHLQSTASTPSTVIPGPHPHHGATVTVLTESSAV